MGAATSEESTSRLDGVKWAIVLFLVAGGIYGNFHFSGEALLYRAAALLLIGAVAAYTAFQTAKGQEFWNLMKGARIEAKRVVWPTKQECNQTTLIVVVFIFVMALILWGLDSFFGWITAMVIG